jgi:putative phosphotransacetylase
VIYVPKVRVGISNRHVHLTSDTYNKLFNSDIECVSNLSQKGEFVSDKIVTLKTCKGTIEHVRVLGPFRKYNQVEISKTDAYKLGLNPPVRRSGNLENSETIEVIGECGSVILENSCILADRHIHMNSEFANKLGVVDNQLVKVAVSGDKACILFVHIKVSDNGVFELHLDFDDANSCELKNGDEVEIIL